MASESEPPQRGLNGNGTIKALLNEHGVRRGLTRLGQEMIAVWRSFRRLREISVGLGQTRRAKSAPASNWCWSARKSMQKRDFGLTGRREHPGSGVAVNAADSDYTPGLACIALGKFACSVR
jgi:hypothetical protein